MSNAQNKACKYNMFTQTLALLTLTTASTMAAAESKWKDSDNDSDSEVAYVDSVTKWGPWELDIEPAAGGLTTSSTGVLKARDSRVVLRTNSISALAPKTVPGNISTNSPVPTPPPTYSGPAAPTTFAPSGATPVTSFSPPPSPNVIPVSPPTSIPSGNGSLF